MSIVKVIQVQLLTNDSNSTPFTKTLATNALYDSMGNILHDRNYIRSNNLRLQKLDGSFVDLSADSLELLKNGGTVFGPNVIANENDSNQSIIFDFENFGDIPKYSSIEKADEYKFIYRIGNSIYGGSNNLSTNHGSNMIFGRDNNSTHSNSIVIGALNKNRINNSILIGQNNNNASISPAGNIMIGNNIVNDNKLIIIGNNYDNGINNFDGITYSKENGIDSFSFGSTVLKSMDISKWNNTGLYNSTFVPSSSLKAIGVDSSNNLKTYDRNVFDYLTIGSKLVTENTFDSLIDNIKIPSDILSQANKTSGFKALGISTNDTSVVTYDRNEFFTRITIDAESLTGADIASMKAISLNKSLISYNTNIDNEVYRPLGVTSFGDFGYWTSPDNRVFTGLYNNTDIPPNVIINSPNFKLACVATSQQKDYLFTKNFSELFTSVVTIGNSVPKGKNLVMLPDNSLCFTDNTKTFHTTIGDLTTLDNYKSLLVDNNNNIYSANRNYFHNGIVMYDSAKNKQVTVDIEYLNILLSNKLTFSDASLTLPYKLIGINSANKLGPIDNLTLPNLFSSSPSDTTGFKSVIIDPSGRLYSGNLSSGSGGSSMNNIQEKNDSTFNTFEFSVGANTGSNTSYIKVPRNYLPEKVYNETWTDTELLNCKQIYIDNKGLLKTMSPTSFIMNLELDDNTSAFGDYNVSFNPTTKKLKYSLKKFTADSVFNTQSNNATDRLVVVKSNKELVSTAMPSFPDASTYTNYRALDSSRPMAISSTGQFNSFDHKLMDLVDISPAINNNKLVTWDPVSKSLSTTNSLPVLDIKEILFSTYNSLLNADSELIYDIVLDENLLIKKMRRDYFNKITIGADVLDKNTIKNFLPIYTKDKKLVSNFRKLAVDLTNNTYGYYEADLSPNVFTTNKVVDNVTQKALCVDATGVISCFENNKFSTIFVGNSELTEQKMAQMLSKITNSFVYDHSTINTYDTFNDTIFNEIPTKMFKSLFFKKSIVSDYKYELLKVNDTDIEAGNNNTIKTGASKYIIFGNENKNVGSNSIIISNDSTIAFDNSIHLGNDLISSTTIKGIYGNDMTSTSGIRSLVVNSFGTIGYTTKSGPTVFSNTEFKIQKPIPSTSYNSSITFTPMQIDTVTASNPQNTEISVVDSNNTGLAYPVFKKANGNIFLPTNTNVNVGTFTFDKSNDNGLNKLVTIDASGTLQNCNIKTIVDQNYLGVTKTNDLYINSNASIPFIGNKILLDSNPAITNMNSVTVSGKLCTADSSTDTAYLPNNSVIKFSNSTDLPDSFDDLSDNSTKLLSVKYSRIHSTSMNEFRRNTRKNLAVEFNTATTTFNPDNMKMSFYGQNDNYIVSIPEYKQYLGPSFINQFSDVNYVLPIKKLQDFIFTLQDNYNMLNSLVNDVEIKFSVPYNISTLNDIKVTAKSLSNSFFPTDITIISQYITGNKFVFTFKIKKISQNFAQTSENEYKYLFAFELRPYITYEESNWQE